jgi:hypothetical protein
VVAELSSGDKEVKRASLAVADGVQLGVPFSGETAPGGLLEKPCIADSVSLKVLEG